MSLAEAYHAIGENTIEETILNALGTSAFIRPHRVGTEFPRVSASHYGNDTYAEITVFLDPTDDEHFTEAVVSKLVVSLFKPYLDPDVSVSESGKEGKYRFFKLLVISV